jgi:hypothetical protein
MELVFPIIAAVVFIVVGIVILIGKGDRFVKPLNRPGAERYNVKRIRLLHALMMFSGSMCFVSFAIFMQNVKLIQILGGVFVFVAAILVVLQYTWAKNR